MPILAVNVDHVATLRQARMGKQPDPVTAAHLAELAGAERIIVHLREDRRHIQDKDLALLRETVKTSLNLEMAATDEMRAKALSTGPDLVCLVPEKREELTTEGGLDAASRTDELKEFLASLHDKGIESSLFIDADPDQIEAAKQIGSEFIEIHTGRYADAKPGKERDDELKKILRAIARAQDLGLKVNLGHGLDYSNIKAFAEVPGISEYSIGHSIVSRALYVGFYEAVREMADTISTFTT
jgi:pyridoxine 5-phosphate synthase